MFVLPSENPIEFVPSVCENDENPLTFLIKPPKKSLILQVQSSLAESSVNNKFTGNNLNKVMNLCLDECVVGWKNCVDENNNPVEFTKENFERINSHDILMELYLKIQEKAYGTEKNESNSTTTAT